MSLDLLLRGAVALACLQLAVLVWRVPGQRQTRMLGVSCCVAVVAFVLTSARGAAQALGPVLVPLTVLCVAKAPVFWLFARSALADAFRVAPRHLVVVAATAVWGTWQQLVFENLAGGAADGLEASAALAFEGLVLGFVGLTLFEAWRGLAGDLVERRRRLRILFVAGGGAYLGVAVVVQSSNFLLKTQTPPLLVAANLAAMLVMALAASWTLVRPRSGSWLGLDTVDSKDRRLDAAERNVLARLQHAFMDQRVYRDEGLTIGRLAARLNVREHELRRAINHGLGYPNFNAFLHAWRIDEACERLAQRDQDHLPVLSIALGVGYGSIGPFNRAFKQRTGMTPTAFRKARARQPSGAGIPAL